MDYRIISAPPSKEDVLKILSVADLKASERVTHTREDKLIEGFILTAFGWLNGMAGYLNGYFMLEQEIEIFAPEFGNVLEIPMRPILDEASVIVSRRNTAGTYDLIPGSDWTLARQDECVVLGALGRASFPEMRAPHPRSYRITFNAGHADPDDVPEGLRASMRLLAGHYYSQREAAFADQRTGNVSREIKFGVKALAGQLRFAADHS